MLYIHFVVYNPPGSQYPGSVKRVGIFSPAAVGPFKLCPVYPPDEKNEDNKEDNEEQMIEATTTR